MIKISFLFLIATFWSKKGLFAIQSILFPNIITSSFSIRFALKLFMQLLNFGWSSFIFSKFVKILPQIAQRLLTILPEILKIEIRKEAEFFYSLWIALNENWSRVFRLMLLFVNPNS